VVLDRAVFDADSWLLLNGQGMVAGAAAKSNAGDLGCREMRRERGQAYRR
jgi:hypothetical protein